MKIREIIEVVNEFAPLSLQESWDNSGIQVGQADAECTGALLCVDVTPEAIDEACAKGCNLIISHHPLLFRGLKQVCLGDNQVQNCVYRAIQRGVTIFSSHTALDCASQGVSRRMALMLGAVPAGPLTPGTDPDTGLGCIAEFAVPMSGVEFVELVKNTFGSPVVRASRRESNVRRIGLCGGAGGEFIPRAIANGCDAYLTSDVRYHDFVDYGGRIFITDIGHFESEECSKQIFYDIITEKYPDFPVIKSTTERNPIRYL